MNDPLIVYRYNDEYEMDSKDYSLFIKQFSNCRRGLYKGMVWDMYIETRILQSYSLEFDRNILDAFAIINQYVKSGMTKDTSMQTYYVPSQQYNYIEYPTQDMVQSVVQQQSTLVPAQNTPQQIVQSAVQQNIPQSGPQSGVQPNVDDLLGTINKYLKKLI